MSNATRFNPGNIRNSSDPWQGKSDVQDDSGFLSFKDATWGIRAMAVTLITYYDKYNLSTIRNIISRWAPPSENDTQSYIQGVVGDTGFQPDAKLDLHEYSNIFPLVKAIIHHEQGEIAYSDDVINAGLARAGVDVPKKPLALRKTIQGAAIAAAGWGATNGPNLIQQSQTLQGLGDYKYFKIGGAALGAVGIILVIIGSIITHDRSVN